MAYKDFERSLRAWRKDAFKRIASSYRGRKLLLDSMPRNILSVTVDCGDHRLTVSPHELVGRYVFARADFGRAHVEEVLSLLAGEGLIAGQSTALEIGANIGTHTVYLGLSGHFARIVAVEPDPDNLHLLRRNVADNDLDDRVAIAACAAGASDAVLDLVRIEGNSGNAGFRHAPAGRETVAVPVKPIPQILDEAGVAAEDVAFVWMDVEGFEAEVCRGMEALLSRSVPIHTEFLPDMMGEADVRDFIGMIERHYERCIVYGENSRQECSPKDLASLKGSHDLLLLPGRRA